MKKFAEYLDAKQDQRIAESIAALEMDADKFFEAVLFVEKQFPDVQQAPAKGRGGWLNSPSLNNMWNTVKGLGAAAINPWTAAGSSRTSAMAMQQHQQTGRIQNIVRQLDNLKSSLKSQLGLNDQQVKQVVGNVDTFLHNTMSNVNKHLSGNADWMADDETGYQTYHKNAANYYASQELGKPYTPPPMAKHAPASKPPMAQHAPANAQVAPPVGNVATAQGGTVGTAATAAPQQRSGNLPWKYKQAQMSPGGQSNRAYVGY